MATPPFIVRNSKTGLAILAATGLGVYLGYTVGLSLLAAGLNPVGAGFLAVFITLALIAALSLLFWGMFVKGPERWAAQKASANYLEAFSDNSPRASRDLAPGSIASFFLNNSSSGDVSDDEVPSPKTAWWSCR